MATSMRFETRERLRITINGIVQGVGFRPFVYRLAVQRGLAGTVKNLGDAGVEILVEGPRDQLERFLTELERRKPPLAKIDRLEVERLPLEVEGALRGFKIEPSGAGGSGTGTIPPDVAICEECLADIRGDGRYRGYWATSCTNCGPRFTTIRGLPYDRPRTSFAPFQMCEACRREYTDPLDRRYHAQTIACPACGPRLYFNGSSAGDPLAEAARALRAGRIVAIKGLGGTHLACDATREEVVLELRRRLNRPSQPFAVMATEEQLPRIAQVSPEEWEMLRSPRRPIVILERKPKAPLAPAIAPGLHTVGVMLPYTGLHYLLLERLDFPVVMTSANLPGRPMLIEDQKIKERLRGIADDLLLHDREIVARCDDSVLRRSGGGWRMIRRSRGWVPTPLEVDLGEEAILALGAELNNTFALYLDGRCYLSQHIGHVDDLETFQFLREALEHLLRLTGARLPRVIACDLHPQFLTTRLAEELTTGRQEGREEGGEDQGQGQRQGQRELIRVQHHHAHIAAVLGEFELERAIGIAVDGVGYGTDGQVWGGEVLLAERAGFVRLGGLRRVPMPGGDLATRFPGRMIAGLLYAAGLRGTELEKALRKYGRFRSARELKLVIKQLERGLNAPWTSSAGRFLDAVSALLGLCRERTYEGEPAMRLEAAAARGGRPLELELPYTYAELEKEGRGVKTELKLKLLDTPALFLELLRLKERGRPIADIAATAQWALACGLARLAIEFAEEHGIEEVALGGGVAYNDAITLTIRREIEQAGFVLYVNEKVPCGDGGISFGQAVVAGAKLKLKLRAAGEQEQE